MSTTDGGTVRTGGEEATVEMETVFEELEELEDIVDTEVEREKVRQTMRTLRRARQPRVFGRFRSSFGLQDAGEALVGSFVFGIPMIVEGGTLEIAEHLSTRLQVLGMTLLVGVALVLGILHAAGFEDVEADRLFGVVPVRLLGVLGIATVTSVVLMTAWGRVDWATPWIATSATGLTAVVMAVGAALGDVVSEP
ncbi:TIGR02587 family membrane protein [Haloarchaeobius salinus]|uniref:TIGR02587 family membrane protein n=1 Tax=Haloarchaeobius salinus TaxID=1198298 RepID=UPI00210A776E|nr:TIGR02587 family membrane protein [Haloarchaeobius salinus]